MEEGSKSFEDVILTLYALCFYNSAKVERGFKGEWYKLNYNGYVNNIGRTCLDIDLHNPLATEIILESKFRPFIYNLDPELRSYIVVREFTLAIIKKLKKKGDITKDWLFWLKAELYLTSDPSEILKQKADSFKERKDGIEFCLD